MQQEEHSQPERVDDATMQEAEDIIEMVDEEGNTTLFRIIDYFFYNGEEYAILTDSTEATTDMADQMDCYVMRIVETTGENGEALEEFVPVEDQALEAKLMDIASTKLNDEDEELNDED